MRENCRVWGIEPHSCPCIIIHLIIHYSTPATITYKVYLHNNCMFIAFVLSQKRKCVGPLVLNYVDRLPLHYTCNYLARAPTKHTYPI